MSDYLPSGTESLPVGSSPNVSDELSYQYPPPPFVNESSPTSIYHSVPPTMQFRLASELAKEQLGQAKDEHSRRWQDIDVYNTDQDARNQFNLESRALHLRDLAQASLTAQQGQQRGDGFTKGMNMSLSPKNLIEYSAPEMYGANEHANKAPYTSGFQELTQAASEHQAPLNAMLPGNDFDFNLNFINTPRKPAPKNNRGSWSARSKKGTLTPVCGVYSPSKGNPPHKIKAPRNNQFKYECPRCHNRFTRTYTLRVQHFAKCIDEWGNPYSSNWNDLCP